jgi:transcriptional regulator with XRE-family HTH domain
MHTKLGRDLRSLREKMGLSLTEVSTALGGTPSSSTIGAYETGTKEPSFKYIIALAKFYNVSLNWLGGLNEARRINPKMEAAVDFTGLTEKAIHNIKTIEKNEEPEENDDLNKSENLNYDDFEGEGGFKFEDFKKHTPPLKVILNNLVEEKVITKVVYSLNSYLKWIVGSKNISENEGALNYKKEIKIARYTLSMDIEKAIETFIRPRKKRIEEYHKNNLDKKWIDVEDIL